MGHNEGVVNQKLLPTPLDDDLPSTLLRTSPPVDWLVGVWVNDGHSREGLGIKLSAGLLFHAGASWVPFPTGSMYHVG